MTYLPLRRSFRSSLVLSGLLLLGAAMISPLAAQVTPDQMAQMTLDSARKAYNEKNYPFAVARFREFIQKFGGHKDAPIARYGLALALLEGPDRDYPGAIEALGPLAGMKDFPDHPFVVYYTGVGQRGMGLRELAQLAAKPQEAPQRKQAANQRFDEASKSFATAAAAFSSRAKDPAPDAKALPLELEWAARALCDQAEMQMRLMKSKEAQAVTAPFVKGSSLTRSRYRPQALYYHGFACFLQGDYLNAGRALSLLTPFSDPVFGTHARYLLARTHHLADEQVEARTHYEGVLADYDNHKKAAIESLKQPDRYKNDPEEKARLEELARGPAPDHVGRSAFYLGVLQYEAGRFADAGAKFAVIPQQFPGSPFVNEAALRLGFCQVQTKDFPKAIQTLAPLVDKEPRLADQALLWLGKAQAGTGDPSKPDQYKQAMNEAINTLRRAADTANKLVTADPEAKVRRAEILIELGDALQNAGQPKDAAAMYETVLNEKGLPQRDEEVLQRRITALHLAGDYAGADATCQKFVQTYPKSTLLPVVQFRFAENAYFQLLAADKITDANGRTKEIARLQDETAKRYQFVIDKYPEYQHLSLARFGLGMVHYRKGDYEKAAAVLENIPASDRGGALATTPYVLAECMIRQAPLKTDDAISAGRAQQQLEAAIEQLNGFIGADPKGAMTPDALIKLGHCLQRIAALQAQPQERNKFLQAARGTYEKLQREFPQSPLVPQSVFERAKSIAQTGDRNGGMNELRRFTNDPLKNSPVAPMAMLELATLYREQNRPEAPNPKAAEDAVKILADARQQYEAAMAKDPARADWVPLLAYHHAVALREAGKLAEARGVFDQVVKTGGNKPEANDAVLRIGQCLQQEGMLKIDAAQKKLATPNLKADEQAQAQKLLEEGYKTLRDVTAYYESQVDPLAKRQAAADARARLQYEAAWAYRVLAGPETDAARSKLAQEALKKWLDDSAKKDPKFKPPAVLPVPQIPAAQVPVVPAELKARAHYQAVLAFTDVPLSIDARLELSELFAQHDDFAGAIAMLNQALDKEPAPGLTEKVRLRLGVCLAASKQTEKALAQFNAIASNAKSPLLGQAHYRAGECFLDMNQPDKAAQRLAIFRDNGQFHNVPGVSDRALLRLGYALGLLGQWDQSRQAYEQMANRFGGNNPWIHEARYGIGWALQNQKQFDPAINYYNQVVAGTPTELGAKAQLQIGLCKLEQKKPAEAATAFLTVPFTYDYPEISAAALVEAARAHTELKQKDQAEKLLLRVIKDHAQSKWAEVAKERLEALKKG